MTEDSVGAFIPGERTRRTGAASGPLAGLSFAAKDLFDVAGTVTGYGNPDWARTHAPATRDALVITQLLQAGASLAGKTKTVECLAGHAEKPRRAGPFPGRVFLWVCCRHGGGPSGFRHGI
jgi:amidase